MASQLARQLGPRGGALGVSLFYTQKHCFSRGATKNKHVNGIETSLNSF